MGQIFPLRNTRGPAIATPCELCGVDVQPGAGYAVIYQDKVDGWVCTQCFEESQEVTGDIFDNIDTADNPNGPLAVIYRCSLN